MIFFFFFLHQILHSVAPALLVLPQLSNSFQIPSLFSLLKRIDSFRFVYQTVCLNTLQA